MSVGSWTPDSEKSADGYLPSESTLREFIALSREQSLESMSDTLAKSVLENDSAAMRLSLDQWKSLSDVFDEQELYFLIQFFTRAEMLLPGWEAGAESPVIWINKILRQRKKPLNKEQLVWIKSNSSNKFIPNGALM
jgi:hypothetical protein